MRLQARIIHLDQLIYAKTVEAPAEPPSPLAAERERLRAAFGVGEIAPRRPEPRLTSSPGRADQSAS
jgi:hypothetical protein